MIVNRVALVIAAALAISGCKPAPSNHALVGRWTVIAIDQAPVPEEKTVIQVDAKGDVTVVSFDDATLSSKASRQDVSDFFKTFTQPKDMANTNYGPGSEIVHRIKGGAQLKYRKLS